MRQPIPLPDGCASLIYSEHFFEHLDYPHDALQFLSESYRILEESGIFSIGVPDTKWPLLDYAGVGDGKYWEATKVWRPERVKTRLDDMNYHFSQDNLECTSACHAMPRSVNPTLESFTDNPS
jgi:predicted SAM-dependent methyltransferase